MVGSRTSQTKYLIPTGRASSWLRERRKEEDKKDPLNNPESYTAPIALLETLGHLIVMNRR
jgi:hypothetical protein